MNQNPVPRMIIILNSISPAEAALERKLLKKASDEILASPQLIDEVMRELRLERKPEKGRKVVSAKEKTAAAAHG
ncbi:MAG: hypothetical protein JWM59_1432 [Verrucomicrobiales bacterium]|nr:hypothetical protein [Verrucomicrobiales bacterium]